MTYQQTGKRENPTQGVEKTKTQKTKQNWGAVWTIVAVTRMFRDVNSSNM
jgi:hypothetical protein